MRPTTSQLAALTRQDPILAEARKRVPPFPDFPSEGPREVRTHFDSLARAIVHQQVSTRAAQTIWGRVCGLSSGRGMARPEQFLEFDEVALRGAGLSRNKLLALRDLALQIEEGRLSLRTLHHRTDEEVVEQLIGVRGIGEWTAQMFLIFRLGRPDVMAPGDMGIQEGMRILDGLEERPTPAQLAKRAEAWRPLRSVASWILWRLTDKPAKG